MKGCAKKGYKTLFSHFTNVKIWIKKYQKHTLIINKDSCGLFQLETLEIIEFSDHRGICSVFTEISEIYSNDTNYYLFTKRIFTSCKNAKIRLHF